MTKPLEGCVAVVTGATRGGGRGIACALGEAGATVYCTGRSVRGGAAVSGRPETVDETAEMVSARGGVGVAARVDHTVPSEVEALFARVSAERGRLDVLVNNVWGGDELAEMQKPFWELDPARGRAMLERAVFSHAVTARYGAPGMVERGAGLIVEVTDGDSFGYRGNLYYDLAKMSVIRLAFAMAWELSRRAPGVTALAVTPGFLRSEAVLEHFGVTERNWREGAKKDPHFVASETPLLVGRAVAALAADPNVRAKAGRVHSSWALAREYGFTDADGSRPDWGAYADATFARPYRRADEQAYASWHDGLLEIADPAWLNHG